MVEEEEKEINKSKKRKRGRPKKIMEGEEGEEE